MKIFFKEPETDKKEIRYLKNTILYYKMLKEADKKEFPKYKLELADLLNKMDIFLLKMKLILSIGGMIGSLVSIMVIFINIFSTERINFNSILYALFLYLFIFVGIISYRTFKRILFEFNNLTMMIEN